MKSTRPNTKAKPAPKALAVVGNYLGRYYLLVGGVTVAFEGDKCRDYGLCDGTLASQPWTRDMMKRAAAKINALASAERLSQSRRYFTPLPN